MSDQSAEGGHVHFPARAPRAEFYIYFAVIFLVAIPFSVIGWFAGIVTEGHMPSQNAVSRAWADAMAITPLIFRA